jgi:NAD(P)-dependent dehydrogenase (short-subunit alcohol dehydrogenase family)
MKKTIVITGCSSGFGRITALALARRGWHVFATVRKEADQESLLSEATERGSQENLTPLLCDITKSGQVAVLVEQVREYLRVNADDAARGGELRLDALMNNAGTAYGGPIELLSLDDLRAQFEINVFAHVAVTQALLSLLKAAHGTVINVSSVGASLATPITGAYNASKAALEVISDAWRVELAPFGVRVVIIQPASSPTAIWHTSLVRAEGKIGHHRDGPYEQLLHVSERVARRLSTQGFPMQVLADMVVHILESPQPRARYVVPWRAALPLLIRRLMFDSAWDGLVRRILQW